MEMWYQIKNRIYALALLGELPASFINPISLIPFLYGRYPHIIKYQIKQVSLQTQPTDGYSALSPQLHAEKQNILGLEVTLTDIHEWDLLLCCSFLIINIIFDAGVVLKRRVTCRSCHISAMCTWHNFISVKKINMCL